MEIFFSGVAFVLGVYGVKEKLVVECACSKFFLSRIFCGTDATISFFNSSFCNWNFGHVEIAVGRFNSSQIINSKVRMQIKRLQYQEIFEINKILKTHNLKKLTSSTKFSK